MISARRGSALRSQRATRRRGRRTGSGASASESVMIGGWDGMGWEEWQRQRWCAVMRRSLSVVDAAPVESGRGRRFEMQREDGRNAGRRGGVRTALQWAMQREGAPPSLSVRLLLAALSVLSLSVTASMSSVCVRLLPSVHCAGASECRRCSPFATAEFLSSPSKTDAEARRWRGWGFRSDGEGGQERAGGEARRDPDGGC